MSRLSAFKPGKALVAEQLAGLRSAREVILPDPGSWMRCFEHDYPSPVACWNHHPEYELHYIRKSAGRLIVGDYIGEFSAGHVALIGPNLPHDWVSQLAPGEHIAKRDVVLQFNGDQLKRSFTFLPELAELQPLLAAASRGLEFTGTTAIRVAEEMEAVGRTKGLERLHHLFGLFALLAGAPARDRRKLASEWFSPSLDEDAAPVVDRVLKYIFANISGKVRMATAARHAGMTEPTFSRFFKRVSGHNFVSMVRKLRVTQACRLLRQTGRPISDICFEVGFGNLSNFNRHFRAEMGMSPSQYRLHENAE